MAIAADADFPGSGDLAYGLAVGEDGAVRLFGRGCTNPSTDCSNEGLWGAAVWAFTPEGAPDRSFGTQGLFYTDALAGGGPPNAFFDAVWCGDGLRLLGFGTNANGDVDGVLPLLRPDGTPDPAAELLAANLIEPDEDDYTLALLDAGDRFWAGGAIRQQSVGYPRAAVFRIMADGGPDPTFDDDGVFVDEVFSSTSWISALAPAPDGGVLAAGVYYAGHGHYHPILWRIGQGGGLVGTFGDGGRLRLSIADYDEGGVLRVLALESGFLAAGYVSDGTHTHLALWRLGPDGAPDAGFGEGGLRLLAGESPADLKEHPIGLALDDQGRIWLAGGVENDAGDLDMAVWRLLPDGSLDPNFCGGGPCTFDNAAGGYGDDWGTAIAFGPEGVVYVAGWSWDGVSRDAVVWKLNLTDVNP